MRPGCNDDRAIEDILNSQTPLSYSGNVHFQSWVWVRRANNKLADSFRDADGEASVRLSGRQLAGRWPRPMKKAVAPRDADRLF